MNRVVGQKDSYFTIIPTKLWLDFRSLQKVDYEQRKVAHTLLRSQTDGQILSSPSDTICYNETFVNL